MAIDDIIVLTHPSGSSAKILKYGATIFQWTLANGTENLFLSDAAKLDGSKAVRGGIPLVFPVFGKSTNHPTSSLPQHGFARISTWRVTDRHNSSSIELTLTPDDLDATSRSQWDYDFKLVYKVELGESELKTEIFIHNPGTNEFDCNALLHTYLRVQDISNVQIGGLGGLTYKDKVAGKTFTEGSTMVKIIGATDRAYESAPLESQVFSTTNVIFTLYRKNFADVVVWNPYEEGAASIGDFEPKDGWKNMICVESGNVAQWMQIPAGGSWNGSQTIRAHL